MTEHLFRGPEDRVHFPRYRKGCWYGRPADCCWLCYGRLLAAIARVSRR